MPSPAELAAIKAALTPARVATFEAAATIKNDLASALDLYVWNAQISSAFLVPQHICEVAIRNAAACVLELLYGPQWPWSAGFLTSLPKPHRGYNMHADLLAVGTQFAGQGAGKAIPELKFAFWVNIFTKRFDQRLWSTHLSAAFPHLPAGLTAAQGRLLIHDELDQIRHLRNRIAHHEPIFKRNLQDDYLRMRNLISWRCPDTAAWVDSLEWVTAWLASKP